MAAALQVQCLSNENDQWINTVKYKTDKVYSCKRVERISKEQYMNAVRQTVVASVRLQPEQFQHACLIIWILELYSCWNAGAAVKLFTYFPRLKLWNLCTFNNSDSILLKKNKVENLHSPAEAVVC